jgi:AraC-like DNA-binding protein
MSGRLSFSTDGLPARDRFPAFCEEVVRRYTGLDLTALDRSNFHASVRLQRVGAIDIGANATSAVRSVRTNKLVRDGDDSILITLVRSGRGYQTQRDCDQALEAGDAVIGDCAYPGELNFTADAKFWNVKVPRQRFMALLPQTPRFAGARLDRNSAARHLLFGYLAALTDLDLSEAEPMTKRCEEHIVALIALALGAEDEGRSLEGRSLECRSLAEYRGGREVRRAAILREIDAFIGDPNLSATAVAARVGITPRYLRMLLAETGKSFSEHLLSRRVARAAAMLRDPSRRHLKISTIAFACGFGDLSYFNRVFRRGLGATPSDIRAATRHGSRD